MNNNEILIFFNSNLSTLYREDNNSNRIWFPEKLEKYWSLFSKFIEINGNELKDLKIPKLDNFIIDLSEVNYNELNFINCQFLGDINFVKSKLKNIKFSRCTFHDGLIFRQLNLSNLEISNSTLGKSLTIEDSTLDSLKINTSKFFENISIINCMFNKDFYIYDSSIAESLTITYSLFSSNGNYLVSNINKIEIELLSFKEYNLVNYLWQELEDSLPKVNMFDDKFIKSILMFRDRGQLFEFININQIRFAKYGNLNYLINIINNSYYNQYTSQYLKLVLHNIIISNVFKIERIDLSDFHFDDSNIENIKFINCDWNIRDRLLLNDEKHLKNGDSMENQYRQLKRIFSKDQNWEMSGLSYISEMEMRKRRLGYAVDDGKRYFSKDAITYLIYFFYGFFGGYTQNFIRPIIIFFSSTLIIFPIIYLFYEPFPINHFNLNMSIQKSLANSLPLIKTDLLYKNWYLKTFQTVFSTIILTFVILALRKRFKQ